jgi:hypothetical protein
MAIKNIPPAEMQLRRDEGLCYFCDERFSHTHCCPNRRLMMLHLTENEEEQIDLDPPEDVLDHAVQRHLSLNAMNGNSEMGIIRFTGTIDNIEVQVFADGGSSDTYLQPRIAQFLKVPIEPTPKFQVLVGNGQCLSVEGMVRQLTVQVQGHKLVVPAYILPVARSGFDFGIIIVSHSGTSYCRLC